MGNTTSKGEEGQQEEEEGGEGFITVAEARSPDEVRQESAEGAILRKVKEIKISKPVLTWEREDLEKLGEYVRRSPLRKRVQEGEAPAGGREGEEDDGMDDVDDIHTTKVPNFVAAMEESSAGVRVQWALEAAFNELAKWYGRQATLVTRQQLGLHDEIEDVSYMAKLAVQGVNNNRESLKTALKDVQGIQALSNDIAALRGAVKQAMQLQEKLDEKLNILDAADATGRHVR